MSVHDYFKPLAPKQSKKDIWQICIPSRSKPYPVRLPKVLQEKTYDLKSSVSIISLPTLSSAKESKRIEFDQPVRSNAFKVTSKLLKRSGIKPDPGETPKRSRQKSKEVRVFIKQEIFHLEQEKFHKSKACNTQEDIFEGFEGKGRVSFDNVKSSDYLKLNLESVRSYASDKSKVSTSVNKKRNSSVKESLSLPFVAKDEFELKGW